MNSIYPIFVDIEKRDPESRVGLIRDLRFSDISIVSDNGTLIQEVKEQRFDDIIGRVVCHVV